MLVEGYSRSSPEWRVGGHRRARRLMLRVLRLSLSATFSTKYCLRVLAEEVVLPAAAAAYVARMFAFVHPMAAPFLSLQAILFRV